MKLQLLFYRFHLYKHYYNNTDIGIYIENNMAYNKLLYVISLILLNDYNNPYVCESIY